MSDEHWNALYPIRMPVVTYAGVRPEDHHAIAVLRLADGRFVDRADADPCRALTIVTCTPALTLGCGASAVSVEGRTGGTQLTRIDVIVKASSKVAMARG
ncbi:hypothetical protein OG705_30150 [Streptomyces sp. NBC_00838]|uniref:hypothetical protein n=1 Tax=Streptomyces sp. NBC_00838 TaxID=2903680 RepID=UPI00386E63D1|nr:hypothetical protein OG705_30150 [Streptomyces sp. NBC_00838]